MRYLRLYEQFRLIKESLGIQGKKLILLSGPSASGKTTFATMRDVVSWLDDVKEIEESGGDSKDRNIQRGTKDLMAAIQAGIKKAPIEDIEDIEETTE